MAAKSFAISILLFALTFSLFNDLALSRSLTTATTLDVSGSVQRTLDVLSIDPQFQKQHLVQQQNTTLSASLSLSLYPRSALHKPHHKDYKALTLSRLARDSARVDSITAKLHLLINGSNLSDLKPKATSMPIISGMHYGSGEYFSRVGVGSPTRQFYMALDTGSDITWIQCKPCTNCYKQKDLVFDPAGSLSYRPVSCGSEQCSSLESSSPCRYGNCRYKVVYNDESHTEGDFATETMSFGASGSFSNITIGCGQDNQGIFAGAAGIIGLGRGSVSMPSQIKATSFSYCLVDRDSRKSSTLEFNSSPPSDSVMVPSLRNPNPRMNTYFYVSLTGISVDNKMLSIPPSIFQVDKSGSGGVIVDSGTTVTRLQPQAYKSLRDSFVQMTQHLTLTTSGFDLYDTCYDLSSWLGTPDYPSVPVVAFHFASDKMLSLKANSVLVPADSKGKFCFAFAAAKDQLSIIGNVQQQGTRVTYDLANSLVGFSANKC